MSICKSVMWVRVTERGGEGVGMLVAQDSTFPYSIPSALTGFPLYISLRRAPVKMLRVKFSEL